MACTTEMFVRLSLHLACTRQALGMHTASIQAKSAQHRKGYLFWLQVSLKLF